MRLAVNFRRVDPSKGGAETYVADLCRRLVLLGHEVDLFAESWREDALAEGVRPIPVAAEGTTKLGRTWDFARRSEAALRSASHDCSIGFINTWHHDVLIPQGGVREASIEANSRRFLPGWRRDLYAMAKKANPKDWLYRAIEARQYDPARGARVVAVSGMVRGHLERFHRVGRDRIRVIPNAIDAGRLAVPDVRNVRASVRERLGLRETDLTALFVGHNFRLKGLPPLLDALALRSRRDPSSRPIHLIVCGGGDLRPFRRRVEELGLLGTVHLVGYLPDVRDGFHAADFFVLPTYYDPCSLVVFEALACGLPVITTACNGAGELIRPGREGFVIPAPDALESLAESLDRMTDDARRAGMAAEARRLGTEQSFDNHLAKLVGLFEEVAAGKRDKIQRRIRSADVAEVPR